MDLSFKRIKLIKAGFYGVAGEKIEEYFSRAAKRKKPAFFHTRLKLTGNVPWYIHF